jgi:hypothetical protein
MKSEFELLPNVLFKNIEMIALVLANGPFAL